MSYDATCTLWPMEEQCFFRDRKVVHRVQEGPTCVATVLSMVSGAEPAAFIGRINTQDPVSWSKALSPFGLKLAFCPTDARRLEHYLPELQAIDDLFLVSYYTPLDPSDILREPNERGWVCSSHIVLMRGSTLFDPGELQPTSWQKHSCRYFHTKRIFRIVPDHHARGL